MSKEAKQILFIALTAVVIVAVMYTINAGKTTGTGSLPTSQQSSQTLGQQQGDGAIVQRIQTLENAIKTNPNDVKALTELGQLYFDSDQIDKAAVAFYGAVQIEPNNATFHNYLGLSYFWTARSSEAIAEFKKAIELDSKMAEAYYNLALALSHSQPSDIPGAIENWNKVIELAPDSPMATKSKDYIDKNKSGSTQTTTAPPLGQTKP